MSQEMAKRLDPDNQWHLDRRVPIALIVTMIIQGIAAVWWASGVTHDVGGLKQEFTEIKNRTTKLERIGEIEVELKNTRESITRIERSLERLLDRQARVTPKNER